MAEASGRSPAIAHREPERIELWRPIGIAAATARAASLWSAEAVGAALDLFGDVVVPCGVSMEIEALDEDGDVEDALRGRPTRSLIRVGEDVMGWTFNDRVLGSGRPADLRSTLDRLGEDDLLVLADHALSAPLPRPGMGLRWTTIAVEWFRVALPTDAIETSPDEENPFIRVHAEGYPETALIPVEREGETWLYNQPHTHGIAVPPMAIAARQEGQHAAARVVLRIDLHWSWWRDVGSASRARLDSVIARLAEGGWRREDVAPDPRDEVRLGRVSAEGVLAAPPPSPAPSTYPVGATIAGGFTIDRVLRSALQGVQAEGSAADGTSVLITTRYAPGGMSASARAGFAYSGAGVASLETIATIAGRVDVVAVVESKPAGVPVAEAFALPIDEVTFVELALGVTGAVRAANEGGAVLHEVRPELVYVDAASGRFAGMAPRAAAVLLGTWPSPEHTTSYPFDDLYVAPEVVAGGYPDARSDVFSLGAVLAHWLTGEYPFVGQGWIAQLGAIHAGNRRPWAGPSAWQEIVDRILSPDPMARPSLEEVEQLLVRGGPGVAPVPVEPSPLVDPMVELQGALRDGDFTRAIEALQRSDEAMQPWAVGLRGVLLAFLGRYEDADLAVSRSDAIYRGIVRGEWQRAARWMRPDSASQITAAAPSPTTNLYAGMAVALLTRDATAAEHIAADLRRIAPGFRGHLWDTSGDDGAIPFGTIADADDAIGQMLECYTDHGLVYFPFEVLRRVEFARPTTWLDSLVPAAVVYLRAGPAYSVRVPRLYANSTTSPDPLTRVGRMTNFDHVGPARRAIGQRDLVINGGMFIGIDRIAAIEFS